MTGFSYTTPVVLVGNSATGEQALRRQGSATGFEQPPPTAVLDTIASTPGTTTLEVRIEVPTSQTDSAHK